MFVFQPFPLSPCITCTVIALGSLRGLMCWDTLSSTPFQCLQWGCLGWRLLVQTCDTREAPCRRRDFTFAPGHLECHGVKQAIEITEKMKRKKRLVLSPQGHPRQPPTDWRDDEGASAKYTVWHIQPSITMCYNAGCLPARLIHMKMSILTATGIFTKKWLQRIQV